MNEFTILRGGSKLLPSGATVRFDGHSHKDVTAEMGPSPLMVSGTLTQPDGKVESFTINVHLEHSPRFSVHGESFEILSHDYNRSMRLRYIPSGTE